jgi:hypothetical protein
MEPKECFHNMQFGYCWLEKGQWMFQAVEVLEHPVREQPVGDPLKVELSDLVFHHDEDEELH